MDIVDSVVSTFLEVGLENFLSLHCVFLTTLNTLEVNLVFIERKCFCDLVFKVFEILSF